MSIRRLNTIQPKNFEFTSDNHVWVEEQISKYPKGRQASAVIPLLWKAQEQIGGWLPELAMLHVAHILDMPHLRVLEVATFYTMFNLSPVGKYFIQLCGTTPCWLRGSDHLKDICKKYIGEQNKVSKNGFFFWQEVECLGACVNAPMVQINNDFYEDLTIETFEKIFQNLITGKDIYSGPQNTRLASEPLNRKTVLKNESL